MDDPEELSAETLRAEMAAVQHSIQQLVKSNQEMERMVENAAEEELDADDVKELKLALKENVGVLERKEALHDEMARQLASQQGVSPQHYHIAQQSEKTPATDAAESEGLHL